MLKAADYTMLLRIIRVIVILAFFGFVGWLFSRDLVLSGELELSHDYLSPSPFFTELVPKQRVEQGAEANGSRFISEPVYTTLRYPRPFQEVDLSIAFKNPDDLFVEFGPQIGLPEVYDLQGLNHPLLNNLLTSEEEWEQVDSQLYQKSFTDYRYTSTEQFLQGLPDIQSVGYYGFDWPVPFIPSFASNTSTTTIKTPLRGAHQFYAAVNKGVLTLEFIVQDLNQLRGEDAIELSVRDWNGEEVSSCRLVDDGETRERGITSEQRVLNCEVSGLSGQQVLLIDFATTTDIIIHEMNVSTPYFVVKDRLWLAGGPDYQSEFGDDALSSVELITSARQWSASTQSRSTLQSIRLAREELILEEPQEAIVYQMPNDQRFLLENGYPMITEQGGVMIAGRGVYAFSQEHYFSPKPWLIDATTNPQTIGIRYLLTDYDPPVEQESGVFVQTMQINLGDVFAPSKALRFQWSLPTMKDRTTFEVQNINARYSSEPVTLQNAREKLLRFIEREF